jgi:peptide/nickel transport system permease protein
VGLIAVLISLSIGILVGALGGYFGGTVDNFVMLLINTVWSIPTLLLVFAIVLALGRGIGIIFFAVGLTMWVEVARIVRGQVKYFKESQFIEAAKSLAFSKSRIIIKHILPNIIGPVLVIASANFATAILIEAGLSYLGFGIRPPAPSIGNMLNENYGFALNGKPMLALIPALTIMLLVLAFNVLGNALRDVFDVKAD